MVKLRLTFLGALMTASMISCDQIPPPVMSDMTPDEQAVVREISRLTGHDYRDNGYLNEAVKDYGEYARGDVTAWARSSLVNLGAPVQAPELFAWALPSGSPEELARSCLNSRCSKALTLETLSVRVSKGNLTVIAGARLKNRSEP